MMNAFGVAIGNAGILVPLFCVVCLPILYAYLQVSSAAYISPYFLISDVHSWVEMYHQNKSIMMTNL